MTTVFENEEKAQCVNPNPFLDGLHMPMKEELTIEDLAGYAGELGLDVERFLRDVEEERHARQIADDVAGAEESGARGTPTFFVGGRRHVGAYDAESLARELREPSPTSA